MAVLVEAISVVLRREAITRTFPGGWVRFVDFAPNLTLCADNELARVGFMNPADVQDFVNSLEDMGLRYIQDCRAVDLVVVDQQRGPAVPCEWINFGHVTLTNGSQRVAAARYKNSSDTTLATPAGWNYEGSLSARFTFVPSEEAANRLRHLRKENGVDIYLDLNTGKEVFAGRAS